MDGARQDKPSVSMKKRPGMWQFMRAALFMLRKCVAPTKPKVVEKRMIENLVGAMRPLHHKIDQPPVEEHHGLENKQQKLLHDLRPPPPLPRNDDEDDDDDMFSIPQESRYASAGNLLELDESQGERDGEPNAIDMKAEEFIAKFYAQIRLQRLDSINRFEEVGERCT
ncbi:hypothetical protein EJ110_NYTH17686 [Nymphaea thermarum]|nr:hypothetical protein EJ110_NYTH17686 [Nymphaea thermarum]